MLAKISEMRRNKRDFEIERDRVALLVAAH